VVTLAILGEVTPAAILTKYRVWGDMVDVITCAIFRDCRVMGVGVVRGVSLPSPVDLTLRPYNTGHTNLWPCDNSVVDCCVFIDKVSCAGDSMSKALQSLRITWYLPVRILGWNCQHFIQWLSSVNEAAVSNHVQVVFFFFSYSCHEP